MVAACSCFSATPFEVLGLTASWSARWRWLDISGATGDASTHVVCIYGPHSTDSALLCAVCLYGLITTRYAKDENFSVVAEHVGEHKTTGTPWKAVLTSIITLGMIVASIVGVHLLTAAFTAIFLLVLTKCLVSKTQL